MSGEPEKSGRLQGQFRKGRSGNPKGKPKGCKHKITRLLEAMGDDAAVDVFKAAVRKAKTGDMVAAKLILDRVAPAQKYRPETFAIAASELETAEGVVGVQRRLVLAVAAGTIQTDQASAVELRLQTLLQQIEAVDLATRLARLEEAWPK